VISGVWVTGEEERGRTASVANKVVFPAFSGQLFQPQEMRQLVSALELRFQSIESQTVDIFDTSPSGSGEFAPIDHTHTESEIIDLQNYLTNINNESIFALSDVAGTPDPDDVLAWDGATFVPQPPGAVGAIDLNDLSDVNAPTPADGEFLAWDDGTGFWVATSGGVGADTLADLTDTDLTSQSTYDLLYNSNGTEWRDTASKLKWNHDFSYLQLELGATINWLDGAFSSIELLDFGYSASVPGVAFSYISDIDTVGDSTTSTTFVDVVNGLNESQAGLVHNDEYMIIHQALTFNNNSGANLNGYRVQANGATLVGADCDYESLGFSVGDTVGQPYVYGGWFTANTAGTAIKAQHHKSGFGTTHEVPISDWFILNLTTSVPNHVKSRTTTTTSIKGTSWTSTDCTAVLGAGDWMVWVGGRFSGFDGTCLPALGLDDGTNQYMLGGKVNEDLGDKFQSGCWFYLDGYAGGTLTVIGSTSGSVINADLDYKCIIALPMSDFAEAYAIQDTNQTATDASVVNSDETIQTLNVASILNTSSNWIYLGWNTHNWTGTTPALGIEVQADVNSGGAAIVAYNNDYQHRKTTNSFSYEGQPIQATATLNAGDSVDMTLVSKCHSASAKYRYHGLGLLLLSTGSTQDEELVVGDPAYGTVIDGLTTNINSPTTVDGTMVITGATVVNDDVLIDPLDSGVTTQSALSVVDATVDLGHFERKAADGAYIEINQAFVSTTNAAGVRLRQAGVDKGFMGFYWADSVMGVGLDYDTSPWVTFDSSSGTGLTIWDAGATDSASFTHDGVDFTTTFTNTDWWFINGLAGSMQIDAGLFVTGIIEGQGGLNLYDGGALTIYDLTDTDSAAFSHDGTDFSVVLSGTTHTRWQGTPGINYFDGTGFGLDIQTTKNYNVDSGYMHLWADGGSGIGADGINGARLRLGTDAFADSAPWPPTFVYEASLGTPAAFEVRFDDLNQPDVTEIRFSSRPANWGNGFDDFAVNIFKAGDKIYLGGVNDGVRYIEFEVSGAPTVQVDYLSVPVTFIGGGNLLDNYVVVMVHENRNFSAARSEQFRIYDAGGTDYAEFTHDGTDFNTSFVSTTQWNVTGVEAIKQDGSIMLQELASAPADTAGYGQYWVGNDNNPYFTADDGVDHNLLTAFTAGIVGDLTNNASGSATLSTTADNYVELFQAQRTNGAHSFILHTQVSDANFSVAKTYIVTALYNETGTGVWQVLLPASDTGVYSSQDYRLEIEVFNTQVTVRAVRTSGVTAGTLSWEVWSGDDANAVTYNAVSGTGVSAVTAIFNPFQIADIKGTDYAEFSHDGTDFNTAFTSTSGWNVTGLTSLDFGQNLLLTTVAGSLQINPAGLTQFLSGKSVRIQDATNTDYADFSHDGTDFLTTFTTTSQWKISGADVVLRDGADLIIYDNVNTDSIRFTHDNTDFFITDEGGTRHVYWTGYSGLHWFDGFGLAVDEQTSQPYGHAGYGVIWADTTGTHIDTSRPRWSADTWMDADTLHPMFSFQSGVAAPGIRELRLNNATQANATEVRVSSAPFNWQSGYDTYAIATMNVGDYIHIATPASGDRRQTYEITGTPVDSGSYLTIPVTHVSTSGFLLNDYVVALVHEKRSFATARSEQFRIYDALGTDYAEFTHDGTDLNTSFVNTTDWNLLDGIDLKIWDAGNTDFGYIRETGTQFQIVADTNPLYFYANFASEAQATMWQTTVGTYLGLGYRFTINDPTDTDEFWFDHTGSEARIVNTSTDDMGFYIGSINKFNITNAQIETVGVNFVVRDGNSIYAFDSTDVDALRIYHDGTDAFIRNNSGTTDLSLYGFAGWVDITGGTQGLRIRDSGQTDWVEMSHDSTDFNFAFTNTDDVNYTGLTNTNSAYKFAHSVASDFGFTARGSIQNLYSSADEIIAYMGMTNSDTTAEFGAYNWFTGAYQPVIVNASSISLRANNSQIAAVNGSVGLAATNGNKLAIYDSTNVDWFQLQHDGTDVNVTSLGTTDLNFFDLASVKFWDGAFVTAYDAGNTDYVYMRDTGTQAQFVAGANGFYWYPQFDTAATNTMFLTSDTLGVGANVSVTLGHSVTTFDSTDTDYIRMRHNGTDGVFEALTTNAYRFKDAPSGVLVHDGGGIWCLDSTDADYVRLNHTGAFADFSFSNTTAMRVLGGIPFRFMDSTNIDFADFQHDGTDFNTAFTTTADWNITGLTGNMLVHANLITQDGHGVYVYDSTNADYVLIQHTGTQAIISTAGVGGGALQFNAANNFCDFSAGQIVRIRDSDNDAYVDLSHDGTDFAATFTGTTDWNITGITDMRLTGAYRVNDAAGPTMVNEAATSTNPTMIPNVADLDSGLGWAAADQPVIVAGAIEAVRYSEASNHIIVDSEVHTGITAGTTQTQAGGFQLLSSHNEVATVATTNDTVVAPLASTGRTLTILNNGVNTLQIFPAVGDDLGAGVDTAITLASGGKLWFVAYDATTWTQFV
jgi:hypothetical protein